MDTPTSRNEQDGQVAPELCCLLTETSWRITHKIRDSPAFAPWKLLYLLVEEMALLFEVLVVRIAFNPSLPKDIYVLKGLVSQDMNVSPEDYQWLQNVFSPQLVEDCLAGDCVIYHHDTTTTETRNYTLRFIDSVLVVPIRSRLGATPLATVEIYYAENGMDVGTRSPVSTAFLRGLSSNPQVQGRLLSLLSDLLAYAVDGTELKDFATKPLPSRSVRNSKLAFLTKWSLDGQPISTVFRDAYRHYFEPLDAVFGSLHDRFVDLPDFYFSYRRSGDDHLSFFPTAKQVGELQEAGMTVGEYKHLWTYPYREGGLNGYVMKTRHSIYLTNQHLDSRFADLPQEDLKEDSPIKYDVEIQKVLVPKLFNSQPKPLYTYIVPIVLDAKDGVLIAMHCTTNDVSRLSNDVRKRMFDFAWESSTAMELALIAQDTTEEKEKLRERVEHAEELVSFSMWLAHTLPKFIFKPSEYYIQKLLLDINKHDPATLLSDYKALAFFNSKGQSELRWFLYFYLRGESLHERRPSGSCTIGAVVSEIQRIFDNVKDLAVVGVLDRHDTAATGCELLRTVARDKVQPIEARLGNVRDLELIDNALSAFDFTVLHKSTDAEFRIKIEGSEEKFYCKLHILNNGRQMEPLVATLLKVILDAARRGPPDMVEQVKGAMEQLKRHVKKENPCQGLYRTARFLHDLDPDHPGYIEFSHEGEWTVFDLYIPKWS